MLLDLRKIAEIFTRLVYLDISVFQYLDLRPCSWWMTMSKIAISTLTLIFL